MKNVKDIILWTALITPFTEEGAVDFDILTTLLHRQEEAGNGILLLGSTGEALALQVEEKKAILEQACSLNLSVPLMVGVGGFNLPDVLKWLRYCESLPIDAYLMVTPLYAKPGIAGQTAWFRALMDSVVRPCMLYNIPGRAGTHLLPGTLKNLEGHPNLWALKEASGSIETFETFRKAAPTVALFSGDDGLMPILAAHGSKGLVSVCSNAWPKETKDYVEASLSGGFGTNFSIWENTTQTLATAGTNPIPIKALMHHQGVLSSPFVRPPLSSDDLEKEQLSRLR